MAGTRTRARGRDRSLGEQLRDLIEGSRLTNYELGKLAGVPEATLWRFRKGERDVTLETAGRICEALGVEPLRARRSASRPSTRPARATRDERPGPDDPGIEVCPNDR